MTLSKVNKILKHLNLWDVRNHDPPEIEPVYIPELTYVEDLDYDNSAEASLRARLSNSSIWNLLELIFLKLSWGITGALYSNSAVSG